MSGNEVEIVVTKRNKAQLDELGTQAKKAGKEVEDGLRKGFKGGEDASEKTKKKIGDDLDDTTKKAGKAGHGAGGAYGAKFAEGLEGTLSGDDMMGKVTDSLKGAGMAAGGIVAVGAAIGGVLMTGLAQSMEQQKIGGLIAAQTGSSAEAGGKLGHVVGRTFGDSFGNSLEDVQSALTAVLQNKLLDTSASEADLQKLTGLAITAGQVVGEEANSIGRAAQQLLRNDLAGNAQEAMDIIVKASQDGLNVNQDLIDTIVEYSTKFRDLGVTGPEALGLISQAMDAGARDTDTAADALKEFAIRAEDGSEATMRGFRSIGLDGEQMGAAIAAGGTQAHQALKQTLDGLRAIHDPVQRDQAAVDLFGTKAEDLGNALYSMDLDTAAAKFGDFSGATQKAADDISESTPAIEKAWRRLSQAPGDALEWASQSDALDDIQKKIHEYSAAKAKATSTDEGFKDRVAAAEDAVRRSTTAIAANTKSLEENISAASKAADGVLTLWNAQNSHAEALEKANQAIKDNGKTLDFHTEKGRANRDALAAVAKTTYDTIDAMEHQGATAQEIQGTIAAQREEFVRLATRMGMSAAEANNLADKLKLIPGTYVANIAANTADADQKLNNTKWLLDQLRNKTVTLTVQEARRYSKEAQFGSFLGTGGVSHAAEGGPRSNRTLVGEYGPEVVDLAPGSMVHSNPDTQRMLSEGGGGRAPSRVDVYVHGDMDNWFVKAFNKARRDGLIDVTAS